MREVDGKVIETHLHNYNIFIQALLFPLIMKLINLVTDKMTRTMSILGVALLAINV